MYAVTIAALMFVALVIRVVYLFTAESTFDSEEVPIQALNLIAGQSAVVDLTANRLYGVANLMSSLSLATLGWHAYALKLPNLILFMVLLGFLGGVAWRLFKHHELKIVAIPVAMLALGPPVIQMWSVKNRGGFVETMCLLTVALWLLGGTMESSPDRRNFRYFLIAVLMGLAIWTQPIALLWVLPTFVFLCALEWGNGFRRAFSTFGIALAGLVLGLLPLININVWHNLNTLRVLEGGESTPEHLDAIGRAWNILVDGIPRLLGLKEQWKPQWILPLPVSVVLYASFLAPAACGAVLAIRQAWRARAMSLPLLLVAIGLCVLAANVVTSWGSFVGEPRRLLLLYIPLALLTAVGLAQYRKTAGIYLLLWVVFATWSSVHYVRANAHGFRDRAYVSLHDVAVFLETNGITGVYTDVWVGNRITFESKGHIPWYKSPYLPSHHGYLSNGSLELDQAALFDVTSAAGAVQAEHLLANLAAARIECSNTVLDGIEVVYGCSDVVDLEQLADYRPAPVLDRSGRLFRLGGGADAIRGLYAPEATHAWTRPHFSIVATLAQAMPDSYLCMQLTLLGHPTTMGVKYKGTKQDVVVTEGTNAIKLGDLEPGEMKLDFAVPAFLPALSGSSDPRHLGVALVAARLAQGGCTRED